MTEHRVSEPLVNTRTSIPLPGQQEGALCSELIAFTVSSGQATVRDMRARFRVLDVLESLKEDDVIDLPGEQAVLAEQLFNGYAWGKCDREVLRIGDALTELAGRGRD